MPLGDRLRVFDGYVASIDTRLRNPRWVIEHVTAAGLKGDGARGNSQFVEDGDIEPRFRAHLGDYRSSGYDRGHMAPAANHKRSQQAMDATFTLSNTCPQVGEGFNRDYWARFERWVQNCAQAYDDVWIVTGPLYIPQPSAAGWSMAHPMLGTPPQLLAVPTHFYKLVLGERAGVAGAQPTRAVAAFVMPNAPIPEAHPLTAYAVPISALEEVAGLKFFPAVLTDAHRGAIDAAALAWQSRGRAQLKALGGGDLGTHALLPAPTPRRALPAPPPTGTQSAPPKFSGGLGWCGCHAREAGRQARTLGAAVSAPMGCPWVSVRHPWNCVMVWDHHR